MEMEMVEKKKVLKQQEQLPEEMVGEILVHLPVKSLLRFSSVSKSWNSMIFESRFAKRYRRCRREKNIVLRGKNRTIIGGGICGPIFPVSSIPSIVGAGGGLRATEFVDCPFGESRLLASCEELWLATDYSRSLPLFLWNPSMRRYKKLPNPSFLVSHDSLAYGLGYDSIGDDYKILKIPNLNTSDDHCCTELYSLKSDSWRKIPDFLDFPKMYSTSMLQSVSGNLHWLSSCGRTPIIYRFDLSTEKFGEVAQPGNYYSPPIPIFWISPIVLNGMLGVAVHCAKCDVWVMEDYGVNTSWTKKFSISGFSFNPQPLYFFQNGDIIVQGKCGATDRGKVFVCRDDETTTPKLVYYVSSGRHFNVKGGEIYVDSLISPAMWSSTP